MSKGTCFAYMLLLKSDSFQTLYEFQKRDNLLAIEYNQSVKTLEYQVFFAHVTELILNLLLKRAQFYAMWYCFGGSGVPSPKCFQFHAIFEKKTGLNNRLAPPPLRLSPISEILDPPLY